MVAIKRCSDSKHNVIFNSEDVTAFSKSLQKARSRKPDSNEIFVWDGFGRDVSDELFEDPSWQQNFVRLFSDEEMWPWKFRYAEADSDQLGNNKLFEALSSPSRGIIASLRIRGFESDDPFHGSLEWFEAIAPYLNNECNKSRELIDNIFEGVRIAKKMGVNLWLEKISLMASNNPQDSITLTPNLHRDGAYGHLESAIVSFYSDRITPNSSTLFFPDFDFEAASQFRPITAEKLRTHFPDATAYSLASGSLAIFSGKRAVDGSKSDTRGALHMSPEGLIPTRRMALLFKSNITC